MYEYTLMLDKKSRRPYMVEEKPVDYAQNKKLNDPDRIARMMSSVYQIGERAEETVYMIAMNTKCDALGIFLIGKGDAKNSICGVRDVFTRALLAGATGVVLIHNHPSGDPSPSSIDKMLAKRIATAGALLEIELLDSIIIGDDMYYSTRTSDPDALSPMEIPDEWI